MKPTLLTSVICSAMVLAAFVFIQINGNTAKVALTTHPKASLSHEVALDTSPDPWF